MECWVPIFDIFFSPCPETEASLWLQKSCNPSSNTIPISTPSFVSLLTKPTGAHFSVSSTPNQDKRWISHLNLDSEEEHLEDEFQLVPDWLRDVAKKNEPLFSWLPISPDELNLKIPTSVCGGGGDESSIGVEEEKKEEDLDEVVEESDAEGTTIDEPLDQERLVNVDSNAKAVELAERRNCRKLFGRSKFD